MARAVETFRHFLRLLRRYDVKEYRAVATSAVREAQNRDQLIRRIHRATGIRLEVIDSDEESRLVRSAVLGALGKRVWPRAILDLGGGSLEISLLRDQEVERNIALPVGTVRLMETFGLNGVLREDQVESLRHHVLAILQAAWPDPPNLSAAVTVLCGGNAEALVRLAAGPHVKGIDVVNMRLLRERLWQIARLDVRSRMKAFGVRQDRAEVMGIGAVLFTTLGDWLQLREALVPGVGVREGVLRDLAIEHFGVASPQDPEARALLEQVRLFAGRLHCEQGHAEQVRRLAASLFEQLAPVHRLPTELRLPLEMAALLHDIGLVVHTKSHHKHGEYLIRHAHIPGLAEHQQMLVACLVRYHSKAGPEPHHKLYASLEARERRQVRMLSALLRIAVGLDDDSRQAVRQVEVITGRKDVYFRVHSDPSAAISFWAARSSAKLFEKELGLRAHFTRGRGKLKDARARREFRSRANRETTGMLRSSAA